MSRRALSFLARTSRIASFGDGDLVDCLFAGIGSEINLLHTLAKRPSRLESVDLFLAEMAKAAKTDESPLRGKEWVLALFVGLFVLLFGFIALTEGVGQSSVPAGDAALVEGVSDGTITMKDFDTAFERAWRGAGLEEAPAPDDEQYTVARETALNDLLDQKWIRGEAAELGITASEREIGNEFESVKSTQFRSEKEYKEFLRETGFTDADVRDRIGIQVLSRKIEEQIRSEVPEPTKKDIERFYEASEEQYRTPEQRDLLLISVPSRKSKEVEQGLEKDDSDKNFSQLAKRLSDDPSASDGGQVSTARGNLPAAVAREVADMAEGETAGPIEDEGKTYFVRVTGIVPETVRPLNKSLSQDIADQLRPNEEQTALQDFIRDYTDKWVSETVCAEELATSRCSNYEASVQNEGADPACYEKEAFEKAREEGREISCPAPVVSSRPMEPGSSAEVDAFGELLVQPLPQGPTPPAGQPSAPAGGVGGVPGGAPTGAPQPGAPQPGQ